MRPLLAGLALALAPLSAVGQQQALRAPTVGLALSGGSAKGFAHVGVLRTLERLGVQVDVVAGTSMGAVIGGLYAIGLSVDSIEHVVTDADWSSLIGDGVPRRRLFLDQRRLDERTIVSVPLEQARITLPAGAIVGSNIMRTLEHVTWRAATVRRFVDLPRPFVAVATDLETGQAVALSEGVLSEALRASSGVPGAIEPFSLDGKLLVDGALSRNLPASDAHALGADFVICSDVSDPINSADELRSMVDVLTQLASLSMLGTTLEQRELCDVLVMPNVDDLSGLDFDQVEEWVRRGAEAASQHEAELRRIAALQQRAPREPARTSVPALLGDSVRISSVIVVGTTESRVAELVRRELELEEGSFVDRTRMEAQLVDLDATGLFGLVHYRLDPRDADGVALSVVVQERARDRLGVGLRYDDERQAALLFTASIHNLLRYGSLTRLDLRVGEETALGVSFNHRRGVTGRFGIGLAGRWSQAPLVLPPIEGGRVDVEIASAVASLGLAAGRATYVGLEAVGERATSDASAASVWLGSARALLDHETLDRIDFPSRGVDATARLEWGVTDAQPDGWFSVWVIEARSYVPLHRRLTLDVGGFAGYARGPDLPPHRRFFLGGTHRSAVFRATHPPFQGLESQEHSGRVVQVGRAGLRWEIGREVYMRAGVDAGAARDAWRFPLELPMTGWSLALGTETLIGPVVFEVSKVWGDRHDPRISIGVGRWF